MPDQNPRAVVKPGLWASILIGEILWCFLAGRSASAWVLQRTILLLATIALGMVLGVFFAFCFTSSGKEEEATLGKIRDWMLAGITGAGVAEIMEGGGFVKRFLMIFSPGDQQGDFALVVSTVALGFGVGFFFMFFQREMNLNVLLAKARALTARAEGVKNASIVVLELLNKLPAHLLTDVNDVSESGLNDDERKVLQDLLYSEDVKKFLEVTEERLSSGASLEWDSIFRTAFIQYYKVYFEPKESRNSQIQEAEVWIQRALLIQPFHAAMTIAYADLKALQNDFVSAARILKDLITNGDPPATALQQLGFYLIEAEDDLESIRYSQMYLQLYPNDSITIFNLAYSYGRMFCNSPSKSELRNECLELLSKALSLDPGHVVKIKEEWIREGFTCLQEDKEFNDLLVRATSLKGALASSLSNTVGSRNAVAEADSSMH
jgi:tetratricopeptide (TPR) repeat protein